MNKCKCGAWISERVGQCEICAGLGKIVLENTPKCSWCGHRKSRHYKGRGLCEQPRSYGVCSCNRYRTKSNPGEIIQKHIKEVG